MFKTATILFLFALLAGSFLGKKRLSSRAWLLFVSIPIVAGLFLLLCSVLVFAWGILP